MFRRVVCEGGDVEWVAEKVIENGEEDGGEENEWEMKGFAENFLDIEFDPFCWNQSKIFDRFF